MHISLNRSSIVLILFSVFIFSQTCFSGVLNNLGLAVGYEEGLSVKMKIPVLPITGYTSFDYRVVGADTVNRNPINAALFKIGADLKVADFERTNLSLFLETGFLMEQFETEAPLNADPPDYKRYNVWSFIGRIGVRPEFFIHKNISISYKLGLEIIKHGTHFKLNDAKDDTESVDDGYLEFGTYLAGSDLSTSYGHNVGLYFYF